jgi:CRISPR-associated protein Cas2
MALVTIVVRDVADRCHGFLASVMLEVSPNVFISPRMSAGIRQRTWIVLNEWHGQEPRGSMVMIWRDLAATGGVGIAHLGEPPRDIIELDGMWVTRRHRTKDAL